jgi:HTH-type transcriptional regulator / antitoxin MqsA
MQCPACITEAMAFKSIDKTIGQGAMAVPLTGLKAHVCAACGEFVLDARSYRRWAAAQDQYVAAARASETHRVRVKLNVSQRELAEAMGVGTLAVSRYERGATTPSGPFLRLLRILDKRPELLQELRNVAA